MASRGPFFSVIVCTYNRAGVLRRALGSVLDQDFTDYELVVVDDGSTDDTPAVVEAATGGRAVYAHQPNQGLGAARNTGVARASGRYVVFLDDDDFALPGWLSGLHRALDGGRHVVGSCGERIADDRGQPVKDRQPCPLGPAFAHLSGWFVPGAFTVRRDAYEAAGGFVPGLEHLHHTEFALRLGPVCAARGWTAGTVEDPLVQRHVHDPGTGRHGAEKLLAGTRYLMAHHRDRLARDPRVLALYASAGGVAAVRAGEHAEARRLLRMSCRVQPRRWRHWARLALAAAPPLADRVWRSRQYRRAAR